MNLDYLGRKPSKNTVLETQIKQLSMNMANLRLTLLGLARASGVKAKDLVKTLQEVDKAEEYMKELTKAENELIEERKNKVAE